MSELLAKAFLSGTLLVSSGLPFAVMAAWPVEAAEADAPRHRMPNTGSNPQIPRADRKP